MFLGVDIYQVLFHIGLFKFFFGLKVNLSICGIGLTAISRLQCFLANKYLMLYEFEAIDIKDTNFREILGANSIVAIMS